MSPPFYQDWSTFSCLDIDRHSVSHAVTRGSGLSLRKWMQDEIGSVLLLGRSQAAPEATDALNRVVLARTSQLLMDRPPSRTSRTWFFLDEVAQGKFRGLEELAANGRKFGCALVAGVQDVELLRQVYGREQANVILGQCAFKALLRQDSPESQAWSAKVLGEEERIDPVLSQTEEGRESQSYQKRRAQIVMPSEFGTIAQADFDRGITGWFTSSVTGPYTHTISGTTLRRTIKARSRKTTSFMPRRESEQYLASWTEDDYRRLRGLDFKKDLGEQSQQRNVSQERELLPDLVH